LVFGETITTAFALADGWMRDFSVSGTWKELLIDCSYLGMNEVLSTKKEKWRVEVA
jgi:hypothetical protein